jgi:site-specific DNA recombinase
MKAIISARVSTEEQRDAGNSLPAQTTRMQAYFDKLGIEVVRAFSFDESAYKDKRDEFDKILDFIKSSEEKLAVGFDKVDRLSRNVFDKRVAELYEMAVADKIELHFVSDGQVINSQMSAVDKFQFGMSLGLAKYYSDAISDNVRRAFEQKRRRGEVTGICVVGYINHTELSGKKTVIPDPQRAHLIVKIFELYGTGNHSMKTVHEEVTRLGLRSRAGKLLTKSTIERILNEPFYCGIRFSKKYNDYNPHPYERLISKELFDRCQDIKDGRRKLPSKPQTNDFIFQGLITCADCGCLASPEYKIKPSGKEYRLYSCTNSKRVCQRRYVNEKKLLEPIFAVLERFESITQDVQDQLVEDLRKTSEAEVAFHHSQINRIRIEQDQLTRRKDKLVNLFLDEGITQQDYDKKLQELTDHLQRLNIELEEHTQADHDYKTSVGTVLSVAQRAKSIFISSEPHEKRAFINLLVQNPQLKDRALQFELKTPFNHVLNLADYASQKSKTTSLSTDRPAWLGGRGSNPRPSR